jgi:hypothetical protein
MLIEKVSILTGRKNVMDIEVTKNQYSQWEKSKIPIQKVFPELSIEEREFLISGITPEEWINYIGGLGDDENGDLL